MSSCIYLLHVSLIAITLGPQPHGDEIAFANTLMTARSIPLAHPSHSATWLLPARAELESLVVWPSRGVVPLGRVRSYLHTARFSEQGAETHQGTGHRHRCRRRDHPAGSTGRLV